MAAILKRQYDLAVLEVTLLPGGFSKEPSPQTDDSVADVRFAIEGLGDGEPLRLPAREMGVPRRLDWDKLRGRGSYPFQLPPEFAAWLDHWREKFDRPGLVLWLHLKRPYGYLGMFPWESLLQPLLPCSVLRLPDFLIDPPQQTPSLIDIAICCQLGKTDPVASMHILAKTAMALSCSGGRRPVRLSVFADPEICRLLSKSTIVSESAKLLLHPIDPGDSLLTTYVVNPIASASAFISNPIRDWLRKSGSSDQPAVLPTSKELLAAAADPVKSPWLRAVRKALGGQSVDVVHVLTNAMLSLENGVLLLDQADLNAQSPASHAVSAQEFLVFQAQIGAWAVGFSSAQNSYSDMGLRQFADNLAQLRPGPLLFHDAVADPECDALSNAFAFLLSELPTTPRQSKATFTYCEPFRVYDDRSPDGTFESLSDQFSDVMLHTSADVKSVFQNTENVPAWVAASERFIDFYKLRLAELSSKGDGVERTEQLDVIRSTLTRLQATVARVAKTDE